jgi:hypothetical protein
MEKYTRECPMCNKVMYHTSKSYRNQSEKLKRVCSSCANSGENNPFYGRKHTDAHKKYIGSIQHNDVYKEGRKKVSKKLKGRFVDLNTKEKISNSLKEYYTHTPIATKGKTFEEIYGTDKAVEFKNKLSDISKSWYDEYKSTDEYKEWISKKDEYELYRLEVDRFTKMNDITVLENYKFKNKYHRYELDHIYPIVMGFKNGVPAELIGHIDNLRIISLKENREKSSKIVDSIIPNIIKDFLNGKTDN